MERWRTRRSRCPSRVRSPPPVTRGVGAVVAGDLGPRREAGVPVAGVASRGRRTGLGPPGPVRRRRSGRRPPRSGRRSSRPVPTATCRKVPFVRWRNSTSAPVDGLRAARSARPSPLRSPGADTWSLPRKAVSTRSVARVGARRRARPDGEAAVRLAHQRGRRGGRRSGHAETSTPVAPVTPVATVVGAGKWMRPPVGTTNASPSLGASYDEIGRGGRREVGLELAPAPAALVGRGHLPDHRELVVEVLPRDRRWRRRRGGR